MSLKTSPILKQFLLICLFCIIIIRKNLPIFALQEQYILNGKFTLLRQCPLKAAQRDGFACTLANNETKQPA